MRSELLLMDWEVERDSLRATRKRFYAVAEIFQRQLQPLENKIRLVREARMKVDVSPRFAPPPAAGHHGTGV